MQELIDLMEQSRRQGIGDIVYIPETKAERQDRLRRESDDFWFKMQFAFVIFVWITLFALIAGAQVYT